MARPLAVVFMFLVILILAAGSVRPAGASTPVWSHAFPTHLAPGPAPGQSTPPAANYDEQIGITFAQDLTSLAYNVTAIAQADSYGYGPAYLMNGLTNAGYWYQIGVSYDWPFINGGYAPGFAMNFEVFDPTGNSVFPTNGGGGLDNFTGLVNSGDSVLLKLGFSGGQVQMSAKDWNTGSTGLETYAAHGNTFVGLSTPANSNGYFSGLMTEWYHVNPYYGSQKDVTYSNPKVTHASAIVWADEFNANTSAVVFADRSSFTFTNPDQFQSWSSNGAVVTANAHTFITGTPSQVSLTVSYSILGGGTGYSAPTISYVQGGITKTTTLNTGPATYVVDTGSSWSVSSSLSGSTASERWASPQSTSGTAAKSTTLDFAYYHQYLLTLAYDVKGGGSGYSPPQIPVTQLGASAVVNGGAATWIDAGSSLRYPAQLPGSSSTEQWVTYVQLTQSVSGPSIENYTYVHQYLVTFNIAVTSAGTGYSPPSVQCVQLGAQKTVPTGVPAWIDAGSFYAYPSTLAGSSAAERWSSTEPSGTASSPGAVSVTYFHQYGLTMSYATTGSPSGAPDLSGTQFGKAFFTGLGVRGNGSVYYLDSGTGWSVPSLLKGSTNQERWLATQPTNGTVSQATSVTFLYSHQFAVGTSVLPSEGGSITTPGGWTDAGSTIKLTQVVNPGWKFEGWTGSGSGAYSGPLNSTSIQVNAPVNESATFYPGLRITAGDNGAVTYAIGSQTRTVHAGSAETVFVPQGTTLSLRATPASFLYTFSGWSPQQYSTGSGGAAVDLQAPASMTASFSLDVLVLGGIAGGVVMVVVVAVVLALRRRGRSES